MLETFVREKSSAMPHKGLRERRESFTGDLTALCGSGFLLPTARFQGSRAGGPLGLMMLFRLVRAAHRATFPHERP
jgi:hypothetical protein